jgi:hypothetical protein
MSLRERPIPEDDFVTKVGLLVTTAVAGLLLLPLLFQSGGFMSAARVVLAGLLVGTIVGVIRRRRESARLANRLWPEGVAPTEQVWSDWLVDAPLAVGWDNRAADGRPAAIAVAQDGAASLPGSAPAWAASYSWTRKSPALKELPETSSTRSARRTILIPARASLPSSYWTGTTRPVSAQAIDFH